MNNKKRPSRPQSPVFLLKIGADQNKVVTPSQNPIFFAKISKISMFLRNKHINVFQDPAFENKTNLRNKHEIVTLVIGSKLLSRSGNGYILPSKSR